VQKKPKKRNREAHDVATEPRGERFVKIPNWHLGALQKGGKGIKNQKTKRWHKSRLASKIESGEAKELKEIRELKEKK